MNPIEKRFSSVGELSPETALRVHTIRTAYQEMARELIQALPASREQSLALTALEESSMWAVKAITHGEVK
jgi:DNA-binding transcriptional regulator YhcF (GntR family)